MKTSELITSLQEAIAAYGDLDIIVQQEESEKLFVSNDGEKLSIQNYPY